MLQFPPMKNKCTTPPSLPSYITHNRRSTGLQKEHKRRCLAKGLGGRRVLSKFQMSFWMSKNWVPGLECGKVERSQRAKRGERKN